MRGRWVESEIERNPVWVTYTGERVKGVLKFCNYEDDRAFPRKRGSRRKS